MIIQMYFSNLSTMSVGFVGGLNVMDNLNMRREIIDCLGINPGPQLNLVLLFSWQDKNRDRFMTSFRALENMLSMGDLAFMGLHISQFKIAVDSFRRYGFVICPSHYVAQQLRDLHCQVGNEHIWVNVVRHVTAMPSYPEICVFFREDHHVPQYVMKYLQLQQGPQDCLILAWSRIDHDFDLMSTTIRALRKLLVSGIVDHRELDVSDFRICLDGIRFFGYILCPDPLAAKLLSGRCVKVVEELVFFDGILSVVRMSSHLDVHQRLGI